ncbi:MAG TPA: hypothetical protein VKT80_18490 [Chloroflexota bacterium]|nr:hypothetical protein [Chloroflexota bacterium]
MRFQPEARWREWGSTWLFRAVVVGFIATGLMTAVLAITYAIAASLGSNEAGAPSLLRWMWGLTHNVVTRQAETILPAAVLLHFLAGITWAVVYAGLVEPRLSGPGWQRGLLFAPLPGILSLVVLLPLLGGGLFGLELGAGPLPIVGNILVHLVYGATLGALYPLESEHVLVDRAEDEVPDDGRAVFRVERTTAIGIVAGLVIGGVGGCLVALVSGPGFPILVGAVNGVLLGAIAGALIGSFTGLEARQG